MGSVRTIRVLQKTPYSFDVSVWEFLWPLMVGARLVLRRPDGHRDPQYLLEIIEREKITTLHFVPSMLFAFAAGLTAERCPSVKRVFCSGEALPQELKESFVQLSRAKLHNLYGPTEASIDMTYWPCEAGDGRSSVPIGKPIANTQIYILDRERQPAPMGVAGELHIGGVGLARGYLNKPELSAEKFINSDFGRLYKTGDLARWTAGGVIEYLGRNDHQIKLRGFRIELGEIEAMLCKHTKEAAVIVSGEGAAMQLVGYYVGSITPAALKEKLQAQLPEYMIPAILMALEKMPLSPNGKLDRNGAAQPEAVAEAYVAPQTETEKSLVEAWQKVLRAARVGVTDNFFALGGDSILSIQAAAAAAELGVRFTVKQLFTHQTIQALAMVATAVDPKAASLPELSGPLPLTPIQQWFFSLDLAQRNHWSQHVVYEPKRPISEEEFRQVVAAIVARHDALRLRFHRREDGQWEQQVGESYDAAKVVSGNVAELAGRAAESFVVEQGQLFTALLVNDGGKQWVVLLAHHLVIDLVSWRMLLVECERMLGGAMLPPRPTPFSQWAAQLAKENASERARAFWLAQAPASELPREQPGNGTVRQHGVARVLVE